MTQPYVGQTVHYRSFGTPGGEYGAECRAAIVTELAPQLYGDLPGVKEDDASLTVLNPTGLFFNRGIAHDETKSRGGTWHHICDADL